MYMRICLASIHPRLLSGQIDSLVGLARALRARGHEVKIISAFAEEDLFDSQRAFARAAEPGRLVPRLARMSRIWRAIEREARVSDLVHLNLPTPSFTLLANLLQARLAVPLVVGFEAHLIGPGDVLPHGRLLAAPKFYGPRLLVNNAAVARLSGFRAAHYVVASAFQAAELAAAGAPPERITTIPNLFDWARLTKDDPVDGQLGELPPDRPRIGYIGHFNHVKGVDLLVRALPEIGARYPDARLILAWSGLGDARPIQQAIAQTGLADRVTILGRVAVGSFLSRCDVCVLPYRLTIGQAAFPGLVLEAMAAGVPLVTSDLPLLCELVGKDQVARLARPEDPLDLARQICALLDDPAGGRAMVERQRRTITARLSPTLLVRRYEELYENTLVGAGAGQAHVLSAARGGS